MSPLQLNMPAEQGAELLLYAYARGVRFLDTADLYGTYPHIRRALVGAPDLVISTKAYCYDRKTASEALERAFRGWTANMSTCSCCMSRNPSTRCAGIRRRWTIFASRKRWVE